MIKTITIPKELRNKAQRANIERDSRRDILLYIMENNLNVSKERIANYQKEYDEKYFEFEQAKATIEKEYVQPAVNNQALNWSLNYDDCVVTIEVADE